MADFYFVYKPVWVQGVGGTMPRKIPNTDYGLGVNGEWYLGKTTDPPQLDKIKEHMPTPVSSECGLGYGLVNLTSIDEYFSELSIAGAANGGVDYAGDAPNEANVRIAHVDPEAASQVLSVAVNGTEITVNLATDADSNITSTATDVAAAVNADGSASVLVTATAEGTGAGIAGVQAMTNMTFAETPTNRALTAEEETNKSAAVKFIDKMAIRQDITANVGDIYDNLSDVSKWLGHLSVAMGYVLNENIAGCPADLKAGFAGILTDKGNTTYRDTTDVCGETTSEQFTKLKERANSIATFLETYYGA